jgi:hypothetical protein
MVLLDVLDPGSALGALWEDDDAACGEAKHHHPPINLRLLFTELFTEPTTPLLLF